jgi:purine-binding chemotaxis protein CheW
MRIEKNTKPAEHLEERTLVTIGMDRETFGVDVSKVQEITGIGEISIVPNAMNFMKGVMNLRGTVIPLIDLRLKFGLSERAYNRLTVVMICEIKGNLIGIIVDSVSDVINITDRDIQDTPHFTSSISMDCIDGIVRIGEKIVVIIDVDRIFTDEELKNLQ